MNFTPNYKIILFVFDFFLATLSEIRDHYYNQKKIENLNTWNVCARECTTFHWTGSSKDFFAIFNILHANALIEFFLMKRIEFLTYCLLHDIYYTNQLNVKIVARIRI